MLNQKYAKFAEKYQGKLLSGRTSLVYMTKILKTIKLCVFVATEDLIGALRMDFAKRAIKLLTTVHTFTRIAVIVSVGFVDLTTGEKTGVV